MHERRVVPDLDKHHRDDGDERRRKPVEVDVDDAELPPQVVDRAELDPEQHPPSHRRHDRRDHRRDSEKCRHDRPPADPPVQEEREPESEQQLCDERGHDDDRGVPHRTEEALVAQERLRVVPETDELGVGAHREVEVQQGKVERVPERKDDDEGDQDERGRGEGERLPLLSLQG